jgi:uncharacterized protein
MISKEKLKEYAKIKNYNIGQAEKDYYQEIILFIMYQEMGKELMFKGGTALTKCYGFDRFSEDLDFTAKENKDFEKIISEGLKKFYLNFNINKEETQSSIKLIYKIQGPLYINTPMSFCRIEIDISLREQIERKPNIKKIGLHIEEIPNFEVVVMNEEEILAEKVRAIMTRNKSRDLYDLYYLLKKNICINMELINKKLCFYNLKYSKKKFIVALKSKEKIWETELKHLVKSYPTYAECLKFVQSKFQNNN